MKAPDKIFVNSIIGTIVCADTAPDSGVEYHISRPGQPCSTDEFLRLLQASEFGAWSRSMAIDEWLSGDFTAAMEWLK